ALVAGDYFTPASGAHAGELGPWARVVESVGIDPRSPVMKTFFVIYGMLWIAAIVAFALGQRWSWFAMLALALGSVWYLTVGTIVSAIVVILLFVPAVRDAFGS
ncbi:MAG: hypothetical protein M3273_04135, partial [Actinomycetota bacterium]|nr:hypothetical protein [Actinomycetota bacterium]